MKPAINVKLVLVLISACCLACGSSTKGGDKQADDESSVNPDARDAAAGGQEDASTQAEDAGTDQNPLEPSDGGTPTDRYPAEGDNDGDGLKNGLELQLHTDPDYIDTDGDGVSDGQEVGADPQNPLDGDGDGFPDALESLELDNDRDGKADQLDGAQAKDWQIVFARLTKAVIANDGMDATTLEVHLLGIKAENVTVGMDTKYWFVPFAPNELQVDGKALGYDRIALFDDATHGDRIAGDGVFTRSGITTQMKPRVIPSHGVTTSRGQVQLGSIELMAEGMPLKRQISYTDGSDYSLFPGNFWVSFIEASELRKVESVSKDAQQTEHVLNVVAPSLMLAAVRVLRQDTEHEDQTNELVALADRLKKQLDFLYVYPSVRSYGALAGANLALSNEVEGTGKEYNPAYPVDRGMQSLIVLAQGAESPIHHETMHQWGVYLDASFGFDTASHHWGAAGTEGVLGGFDATSLIDHGDGTYTLDRFELRGGDWATTPYSSIELYLMGLLEADKVAPIPILINPTITSGTDTTVTVKSQLRTVTIDDIIAKHGARVPDANSAPKQFETAFVIVSEHLLSPAELAWVDSRARAVETTTPNEMLSFERATRGLGSMRTRLAAP